MDSSHVCFLHPATTACALCAGCGVGVCEVCVRRLNTAPFCESCAANRHEQSPVSACVFAILLPGMGQVYNQEWGKAVIVFLTGWLLVPWVWGVVDACRGAQAIRAGHVPTSSVWPGFVILTIKLLAPVLLGGYIGLVLLVAMAITWALQ